jgi:para-aminobenzoate synthetase component 1
MKELNLENLLSFLRKHDVFMFLNSNRDKSRMSGNDKYSSYDWVVAAGAKAELTSSNNAFESLKQFYQKQQDWLFGVLSYDLKNDIEKLSSVNFDGIEAPLMHFFSPQYLLTCIDELLNIVIGDKTLVEINGEALRKNNVNFNTDHSVTSDFKLRQRVSKVQYIHDVNNIKQHIHHGDIYEMNYCMEFYAEDVFIDPYETYLTLSELSPTPFSCFYRNRDIYLMSASPERFLRKNGNSIISQPMKGTMKRGITETEDAQLKMQLKNDPKEQSENVMIVDLVRNDLSKHAKRGTVKVDELFGTYTFPQVHQMISTVSGELEPGTHFTDVIKDSFPMGSMTGAPKVSAMQLIEQYEKTKRGLYSGAIGYITPEGNFDFNVVIRSILYNSKKKYLSFTVGSAITAASDAEKEYDECLLKAKAMTEALTISLMYKV